MSRQYASQLLLEVEPSKIYRLLVLLVSSLVMLSIVVLDVNNIFVNVFLAMLVMFSIILALKNNQARVLHWQANNAWLIEQDEIQLGAYLLQGSVMTPFFGVLNFRCDSGKRINVVIFKDSLNYDAFRKLRVKLKVEGIVATGRDTL